MKLEQQVCSLDLARRLKELGVKQESYFSWGGTSTGMGLEGLFSAEDKAEQILSERWSGMDFASAFTVAELGEMLPWRSKSMGVMDTELAHPKVSLQNKFAYRTVYYEEDQGLDAIKADSGYCDTEADARAKMLIFLLENGLMTPEGKAI